MHGSSLPVNVASSSVSTKSAPSAPSKRLAFDPKKWTHKTQEAFAAAIDQAKSNSNPEITPDHVLVALMGQDGSIAPRGLGRHIPAQRRGIREPLLQVRFEGGKTADLRVGKTYKFHDTTKPHEAGNRPGQNH